MTEAEWLACEDPVSMVEYLRDKGSGRKLRLFGCACCRRFSDDLHYYEEMWTQVETVERFVDGAAAREELEANSGAAFGVLFGFRLHPGRSRKATAGCAVMWLWPDLELDELMGCAREIAELKAAEQVMEESSRKRSYWLWKRRPRVNETERRAAEVRGSISERLAHCDLLRDIFGNPLRPVAVDPSWLTRDVIALARGIYDERAFDRMPILADALQDAGCDNADVLDHCRGHGPHVRGCWVVDLVLGKA